jgi:hypothetical protein
MSARAHLQAVCLLALVISPLPAQEFDHYLNPILTKVPTTKGVKELKQLTSDLIIDNDRVTSKASAAMIVVRTNQGRFAKLLVQSARQKIDNEKTIPILYIERFVTYREGEERAVLASGQKLSLFPGFRLNLDLGQIVPEQLGGDLRFVADGGKSYTEPLGKAKLYLLTQPIPEAKPIKGPKAVIGETFEAKYFAGTFKLHDDGKRSGKLKLTVDGEGNVEGVYYSDRDGRKYDVKGKVGTPLNTIQFTIKLPRTEQVFQGWMFTGDGKAIVGTSRIIQHEAGFYALRVEE